MRMLSTVNRKARTRKKVSTLFKFFLFLVPRWTNLLFVSLSLLSVRFVLLFCIHKRWPFSLQSWGKTFQQQLPDLDHLDIESIEEQESDTATSGFVRWDVSTKLLSTLPHCTLLNRPLHNPIQPSFPSKLALPLNLGVQELSRLQPTQLQFYQASLANQPGQAKKKKLAFSSNWISTHRSAVFLRQGWSN